jgi:hypothetical protein
MNVIRGVCNIILVCHCGFAMQHESPAPFAAHLVICLIYKLFCESLKIASMPTVFLITRECALESFSSLMRASYSDLIAIVLAKGTPERISLLPPLLPSSRDHSPQRSPIDSADSVNYSS